MKKGLSEKELSALYGAYKDSDAVACEIIRLNSILGLPKGTEHFLSDLHGEAEAFLHIRKSASGVIRRKIDALFAKTLTDSERAELSTLIYYPEEKLSLLASEMTAERWCALLCHLMSVCRLVSEKYPTSRVRERIRGVADSYHEIIEELTWRSVSSSHVESVVSEAMGLGVSRELVCAVCSVIKSLAVDHLHVIGDIFDRGARPDVIMDGLMVEPSVDIQWGNHDVLWLGAAAGVDASIACVLNNSLSYKNLDVLEIGYGISLRPLALFAQEVYADTPAEIYMPRGTGGDFLLHDDEMLLARMRKAISIIQFKLEGEIIQRNPDFDMNDRLLLDKIDFVGKTVKIKGVSYPLKDTEFPTVDPNAPYHLTEREAELVDYLHHAFLSSEKLQKHARFLYKVGSIYKIYNGNLLFHGSIPMEDNGEFSPCLFARGRRGRELMDYCDSMARRAYFAPHGTLERLFGGDFLWFLWCGKNSPLTGRERITTFERLLVEDRNTWHEPKNPYYRIWDNAEISRRISKEFSLDPDSSYIVNGHIPVNKGESPIKSGGRLIVIDGGFCSAYHSATGIAGYTLIYNADGLRLCAHAAFCGRRQSIENNRDVIAETVVFRPSGDKMCIADTDLGRAIKEKINDLTLLRL